MNLNFNFKSFPFLLLIAVSLFGWNAVEAQQNNQSAQKTEAQKTEEVKDGDVAIMANVTAKELKFEIVPNPTVEFFGTFERKNIWDAERRNLPETVQPGITYRNIGIRLRIVSRFADIERIVSEALGEIPVSDAPNSAATTEKNASAPQTPKTPQNSSPISPARTKPKQ